MRRVLPDTNVPCPFSVMDLLLALTEDAPHEVSWIDVLLDEWEVVIVRAKAHARDHSAHRYGNPVLLRRQQGRARRVGGTHRRDAWTRR